MLLEDRDHFGRVGNRPVWSDGLEKLNLQYRCEFFNLLNRASFSAPALNPANSSFGTITGRENLSRSIQMALRLIW